MKNLISKIISLILTLSIIFGTNVPAFASTINSESINNTTNTKSVEVTDEGIYIDGLFYSNEAFSKLLNNAVELEIPQVRSITGGLVAGSFAIPGLGAFVVTAAGVIIFQDEIIEAGSAIYSTISKWFEDGKNEKYQKVVDSVPSRLRDGNTVELGNFNEKVSGKKAYKEKKDGQ